jgi:hypothetical protein
MYSQETAGQVWPLAQKFDSADQIVMPISGTPLSALVKTLPVDIIGSSNFSDAAPIIMSPSSENGGDVYGVTMDEITAAVSEAVRGHLLVAKTVVAPFVQTLVERTQEQLANRSISEITGMNIVVSDLPSPMTEPGLGDVIAAGTGVAFEETPASMNLPAMTDEQIREIMSTGSASVEAAVDAWLSSKGAGFLQKVWTSFFQPNSNPASLGNAPGVTFNSLVGQTSDGVDYALVCYLVAKKIWNAPPEGTEMPMDVYEQRMSTYRDQALGAMARHMESYNSQAKNGVIILSAVDRSRIVVNGAAYRAFLASGGTNEAIFGAVINNTSMVGVATADSLMSKIEESTAAWGRFMAITRTTEANSLHERIRTTLVYNFTTLLSDDADPALDGVDKSQIRQAFVDESIKLSTDQLQNLYAAALHLTCVSRFAHTEAERILSGIARVAAANPGIDPREAAAVSTIEYIAYWVGSQMEAVSINSFAA